MDKQVLVVGAGPVGLTMAAELARYGVSVRIVDKAAQRTDKSKALVVWTRTLELLDRAGCADRFVAAGQKLVAASILTGDRTIGHISLTAVLSVYPFALALPQSETERLLEEHLAGLGVAVERSVELLHFTDTGGAVSSTLRHPDGREEMLETAWLIACDGAHSTVRHALGLRFDGDTLPSDWILADVHLSGARPPASEMTAYWHEDGVLAVLPISGDRYRIIADVPHTDASRADPPRADPPRADPPRADSPRADASRADPPRVSDPTLDEVQAIVDRRGPVGLELSDSVWLSGFRINERKVANYRSGRIFVAGDAAHVHSPAGGQGMNTGMQDAINLAWKLALICSGTGNAAKLLDSYSAERSPVGAQVLATSGRLTAVGVMHNRAAQVVRNLVASFLFGLAPLQRAMAETMTEVSVGYPHSPLNGPAASGLDGPSPGDRAAPVAGQPPVGAGGTPRFALFAAPGEAVSDLLRQHPNLLEPAVRAPFSRGGVWLVRPDGYTACVAAAADIAPIANYLRDFGAAASAG
ncbi:MAG TPA: FAD-dependent monooxygenase [Rhodopila sp.]